MTAPPHEWPTSSTLPGIRSIARWVASTSAASEVSGFWTAQTRNPSLRSVGTTSSQLEPSAQAPCTSTIEILSLLVMVDSPLELLTNQCLKFALSGHHALVGKLVTRSRHSRSGGVSKLLAIDS